LSESHHLSDLINLDAYKNNKEIQGSNKDITDLENDFKRLIESREEYQQIRLIGVKNNGREIIRVNRKGRNTEIVLFSDLQEKGKTHYFIETIKLPQGKYYISDIELNREHGKIDLPETPVIRVSKPVYTRMGKLFGIIIINVDLTIPLNNLNNYLDIGEEFTLVSSDKSTVNQSFSNVVRPNQLNSPIKKNGQTQRSKRGGNSSDAIVAQNRLDLKDGRYFTFILSKPVSLVTAKGSAIIEDTEIVFVILLLTIGWILVFTARYPLKQISNVSYIIKGITDGTRNRAELPIHKRSEIGDLSRAFNKLLDNICETQSDLKLGKEQLELAIKGASDGLWDWNLITGDFYLSPRWKVMFGYRDDEIKNELDEFNRLIHPDDVKKTWDLTNAYLEGKEKKCEIEFRMHHKEGHYVDVLCRAHAVRDENNNAIRLVGTHTDITERNRESEKRLQYELDQKKALVREVHHRIKNNLQGVASLLRQHAELNPSARNQLEAATSQVYTMALVHGIQGKGVHEGMPVSKMLKEILAVAENITGTNIIYKGDNNYCQYDVNERESVPVALIINELVTNACKHSQEESSVNVSVECNWCLDESILIEITNKVDSFPKDLSIEEKNGLGTGLNLVVSLLPPEGASLNIREEDGICTTRLVLGKPVIYVGCELNVVEVVQT
jgi:PAS domain S-box-containing protein